MRQSSGWLASGTGLAKCVAVKRSTALGWIVVALLAPLTVRCGHSPQTRKQMACEKQANACLRDCSATQGLPIGCHDDPNCFKGSELGGCDGNDSRSECERRCHELCEYESWGE